MSEFRGYQVELAAGGRTIIHNIYCIGRNYAEHAAELNNPLPKEPVVFLKSLASLRALMDSGVNAFPGETFHHEAELILLIGKEITNERQCQWSSISHVGLGLDLTRREVQNDLKEKGLPWTRAKSFAGSAIVAPLLATELLKDRNKIEFSFSINGQERQRGNSSMMLFKIEQILVSLLQLHPLRPGDLIFTGTPKGVGPIKSGDLMQLDLSGLEYSFSGVL